METTGVIPSSGIYHWKSTSSILGEQKVPLLKTIEQSAVLSSLKTRLTSSVTKKLTSLLNTIKPNLHLT